TAWGARLFAYIAPPLDRLAFRLSGGKVFAVALLSGLPIALVTTRGARSGLPRQTSLVILRDGEKIILIASNFGGKNSPAWYYNLRAHPEATVSMGGEARPYRAREAQENEYNQYWQMAVRLYPGYAGYKQRAAPRSIPILVLSLLPPVPDP
ncbi:MAG: nitroreductase family deazaflavin-dependent oxidoreductase, partial [Chloroflexi bacterium]|nr:nitroreductase family deazaflavin-dependent oxidoreductase [Chloroflexota bacterium]